jgi:hypothetical protein
MLKNKKSFSRPTLKKAFSSLIQFRNVHLKTCTYFSLFLKMQVSPMLNVFHVKSQRIVFETCYILSEFVPKSRGEPLDFRWWCRGWMTQHKLWRGRSCVDIGGRFRKFSSEIPTEWRRFSTEALSSSALRRSGIPVKKR